MTQADTPNQPRLFCGALRRAVQLLYLCAAPMVYAEDTEPASAQSVDATPSVMMRPSVKTLDGIIVRPKVNPLEESDRHLQDLIDGLPEGEPPPDNSAVARFFDWARRDPNALRPEDQQKLVRGHCQARSLTFNEIDRCDPPLDR
jgi:hypothetical protein